MIGIIDYGMGNLCSIYHAMAYLGYSVKIISQPEELKKVKGIILPGVGAFPKAMDHLIEKDFPGVLKEEINQGKPLLGICLGMQLLFERGYEDEKRSGLGLLSGDIKKINVEKTESLKIPHMGWNRLVCTREHPLWRGLSPQPYVYYVHSYCLSDMTGDVIGTTYYGGEIGVAVARENVIGLQFHPEKSGEEGLKILQNFGEMIQ